MSVSSVDLKMKHSIILIVYHFITIINGNRISGGTVVSISDYPFATALLCNYGDGAYNQVCGGTILSANAILSAASCFSDANNIEHPVSWWRARVGSTNSDSRGMIYFIRNIVRHPNFQMSTRDNDIAVLRTTFNMVLIPNVVEQAFIAGGAYNLSTNQVVWAIGWGATSAQVTSSPELRHVQVWLIEQQTCIIRYNDVGFNVTDNMICAGWLDVGIRGQCQGDNGSPLLHNGVVIGVYSWTEGCAQPRYPSINTRVPLYARWIEAAAIA